DKAVEVIEPPEAIVRRVVRLDSARLGKRLRGDVKKVQAAIDAGAYELVDEGERLHAAGHTLEPGDFAFRFEAAAEGKGVAAHDKLVVVLDLTTDPVRGA